MIKSAAPYGRCYLCGGIMQIHPKSDLFLECSRCGHVARRVMPNPYEKLFDEEIRGKLQLRKGRGGGREKKSSNRKKKRRHFQYWY